MRRWAKWTLGVAAAVVGVVALRFGVAFLRGDEAVPLPPVATHGADAFGDPLPEGAVARIGTIRWRAHGPAVWAPDGEHLIVGGWDDELLAMNVKTGLVDWTMPGHAGKIALNVEFRDLERIVRTGELPTVTDSLDAMVLMPGGHRLLTSGRSHRVWDLDTRTEVVRIPLRGGSVWPAAASPDGKLSAFAWGDRVRVVDLTTGERRVRIDVGADSSCVAFDRDGTHVVVGMTDGRVAIAPVSGGEATFVKGSDTRILQILVPGDGAAFWALDQKGVVTIRSLDLPDAPARLILRTETEPMQSFGAMVASPDGRTIAVSWGNEAIRWLDAATAEPVAGPTSEPGLRAVGWSPDGKLFAARQGDVYRFFGAGAPSAPFAPDAPTRPIGVVVFSPDGKSIALHDGTTTRIADAVTGAVCVQFAAGRWGTEIAWTRDGASLVLGMSGPRVVGIDAASGREVWVYDPDPAAQQRGPSARLGPDAASASWMGADGDIHVVDLRSPTRATSRIPVFAKTPNRGWYGLALSSGARRVAVIQDVPRATPESPNATQMTLRAWNVGAATPFAEIAVSVSEHPALSRDGRFAAAGWFRGLVVFDLDASPPREIGRVAWTTRERDSWTGFDGCTAFSSDGARVATGDLDGVVHVFAVPSCVEIATFRGHRAPIDSIAFSDDGSRLVSGSADMTALVWDVSKLAAPPAVPAAK